MAKVNLNEDTHQVNNNLAVVWSAKKMWRKSSHKVKGFAEEKGGEGGGRRPKMFWGRLSLLVGGYLNKYNLNAGQIILHLICS